MDPAEQRHNHRDTMEREPEPPTIQQTLLANPLREICQALADEVAAARTDSSRAFEVTEGSRVYGSDDGHLYTFRTDIAIPIPAETPVRIFVEGRETAEGVLVAQHDFDVLVQLRYNLGEAIARARLSSEPWFIVAALRQRLEEETQRAAADIRLPMALLGLDVLPTSEDSQAATRGVQILAALGIPSLVLDAAQRAALSRCIGSRLHFVWGPPGTGKTACLAQVVRTLVDSGERVLVLAHANAAVDVAILRVADAFLASEELSGGKVLRLGVPQLPEVRLRREILPETIIERTQPELIGQKRRLELRRQKLSDRLRSAASHEQRQPLGHELEAVRQELAVIDETLRQALIGVIRNAQVVAATLSRLAIDDILWNWPVDTIILDETSMAGFPAVLAAALRARKRLLLFGDFRQLPPIHLAQSRVARQWLGRDAFEVAGVRQHVEAEETESRVTLLDTQYRMALPIAAVISQLAYGGRLQTGPGVAKAVQVLRAFGPWPDDSVVLVDTSRLQPVCFREPRIGSYSRVNPVHADVAVTLAAQAAADGCANLALVTPYRVHARLLSVLSRQLVEAGTAVVATIHRFQGSERDMVIVDLVDAPLEKGASKLTGNDEDTALRLLNVALSRPRRKLVVLAHATFIRQRHPKRSPARRVLRLLAEQGRIVSLDAAILQQAQTTRDITWIDNWDDGQAQLAWDLQSASGPVYINFPPDFLPAPALVSAPQALAIRASHVVLFAPMPIAQALEDSPVDLRLMNRPGGFFALLDHRFAYVGGYSPAGIIARIDISGAVEVLEGLLLGSILAAPPPRAEVEQALTGICGRCPNCGEDRRPHAGTGGTWVLRCANPRHRSAGLDVERLNAIAAAMEIRCPVCQTLAVARSTGHYVFLGCGTYGRACRGRLPTLDELFGGA